jgi:enterochelin esterase-like enzyme
MDVTRHQGKEAGLLAPLFVGVQVVLALVLGLGISFAQAGDDKAAVATPPQVTISLTSPAPPPSAARVVEGSFWSASLARNMPLTVYLPQSYDSSSRPFPVLYMLHGLGGSNKDWQRWGLFDTATQLISKGEVPPMIIVTPAGESGYWIDHFNGGPRYGSYIARDLVAHIDATYRTLPGGQFRAIGGMSMGAHGALQLALNNPGEFSIVGAHSLVLRTKQQAFAFFGDQQYYEKHDPVSILAKSPERARWLRIWIDIGRSDSWFKSTNAFRQQLVSQAIPHDWRDWEGGHDAAYCSAHIVDYLRYYGAAFESRLSLSSTH